MNEIIKALSNDLGASEASEFTVETLKENSLWFAGRSSSGRAVFIVAEKVDYARSIKTGALTIEIGQELEAATFEGFQRNLDRCLVLSLSSRDSNLEIYFSEICLALARQISGVEDHDEILEHLRTLVSLFGLAQSNRNEIKGLWGELKFAALFDDPEPVIASWHSSSFGRIDFQGKKHSWEVKTAEGRSRRHHFNLDQLNEIETNVVSLVVEETPEGESIEDLLNRLSNKLSLESGYKLRLRVLKHVGNPLIRELRFRLMTEDLSPRFYKSGVLPRPLVSDNEKHIIAEVSFSLIIPEFVPHLELLERGRERLSEQSKAVLIDPGPLEY
jgi:hypothetical protein